METLPKTATLWERHYADEELGEFVVHRFAALRRDRPVWQSYGSHRGLLSGDGAVHMDDL